MSSTLLTENDPAPVWIENENTSTPILLTCEHARNTIPEKLGTLGLEPEHLERHYAYDVGIEGVTRYMSKILNATAIYAGYSRLIVDPNRPVNHKQFIVENGEATPIPGNLNLSEEDVSQRLDEIYTPYYTELKQLVESKYKINNTIPAVLSMHSMTRKLFGKVRPDTSALWRGDDRLAKPFKEYFESRNISYGDNDPYSLKEYRGIPIELFGFDNGYPSVMIELCNDLIRTEENQKIWAEHCSAALQDVLNDPATYSLFKINKA